jgi:uncharacterized membrane protein YccC
LGYSQLSSIGRFCLLILAAGSNMTSTMNMTALLTSLGIQFPLIVVCFLGLILALTQINRLPRAAAFVVAGLGLYLLIGLSQSFAQPFVQSLLMQTTNRGRGPLNFSLVSASIAFSFNIFRAVAIALVAYAAFVDRPMRAFLIPATAGRTGLGEGKQGEGKQYPGSVS